MQPLVNLLVVPVFAFVTVPAALTGIVLDGPLKWAGDGALHVAATSIGVVDALIGLDPWRAAARVFSPGVSSLAIALLATAWAVLPPGWPGRNASLPALVAVALWQPSGVPPGCFRLTMLDVGQGQSILVETTRTALLYDTGPGWPGGG